MKVCSKCKQEMPLCAFGKQATGRQGVRANCRRCQTGGNRYPIGYNFNKERAARFNSEGRGGEGNRMCTGCNRVFPERYYTKTSGKCIHCRYTPERAERIVDGWNGERVCIRCGEKKDLDQFGYATKARTYRRTSCFDCDSERNREYYAESPEYRAKMRAHNVRRVARLRELPNEEFTHLEIFERDNWTCQICNREVPRDLDDLYHPDYPQLDHIVPLSYTGPDNPGHVRSNVQLAHRLCNIRKSNKLETTNR